MERAAWDAARASVAQEARSKATRYSSTRSVPGPGVSQAGARTRLQPSGHADMHGFNPWQKLPEGGIEPLVFYTHRGRSHVQAPAWFAPAVLSFPGWLLRRRSARPFGSPRPSFPLRATLPNAFRGQDGHPASPASVHNFRATEACSCSPQGSSFPTGPYSRRTTVLRPTSTNQIPNGQPQGLQCKAKVAGNDLTRLATRSSA